MLQVPITPYQPADADRNVVVQPAITRIVFTFGPFDPYRT